MLLKNYFSLNGDMANDFMNMQDNTDQAEDHFSLEQQILDVIECGGSIGHGYDYPEDKFSGNQITTVLDNAGYTNLGWLNSGARIPDGVDFRKIYSNWSGSYCIYLDDFKRYYCVDMGD